MGDVGKGIALAAKVYSFRPSIAMGIEGRFNQIMFDVMAATVAAEVEADAQQGTGGSNVPRLGSDAQQTLQERLRAQEKMVKQKV